MAGVTAVAEIDLNARLEDVWTALTDPAQIEQYMFGSKVETDWNPGGPIVWKGEWDGKPFEDKGEVLEVRSPRYLKLTHFSPLSGKADSPENYHTLEYELSDRDGKTHLRLSQDGNASEDEAEHSKQNWTAMLNSLKKVVEDQKS